MRICSEQDGGYHVPVAHPDLAAALDLATYSSKLYRASSVQSCRAKGDSTTRIGNHFPPTCMLMASRSECCLISAVLQHTLQDFLSAELQSKRIPEICLGKHCVPMHHLAADWSESDAHCQVQAS